MHIVVINGAWVPLLVEQADEPHIDPPSQAESVLPVSIALAEWPLAARVCRRLRSAEDIGVGDTIHRQLGTPGRWFESVMAALAINCGCTDRRLLLNSRFPYSD